MSLSIIMEALVRIEGDLKIIMGMSAQEKRHKEERLLSDKDVAQMLGVSRDQVWRLNRSGVLPKPRTLKIEGRERGSTRWKHSEILVFINSLEVDGGAV